MFLAKQTYAAPQTVSGRNPFPVTALCLRSVAGLTGARQ